MEIVPGCKLHWEELACHDKLGTPYPEDLRQSVLMARLLPAWRGLRRRNGNKPITVLSAFRTDSYNEEIGGEHGSWHCRGAALDLSAGNHRPAFDFARIAVTEAQEGGIIRGVGWYPDFGQVHIDVRPGAPVVLWRCVATYNTLPSGKRKLVRLYFPWSGEGHE